MGTFSQVAGAVARASASGSCLHHGFTLSSAFQPLFGVERSGAAGHEALVRVADAAGRPVRPEDLFASLADDEVVRLDWTCRALHLRNFAAAPNRDTGMLFLNVHPLAAVEDVGHLPGFLDRVAAAGLSPRRICLEILESACGDESRLAESVAAYREAGFTIAMDDFGVARSNFDRVAALGPDFVKIDRSILADALGDDTARRMLPHVVKILHEAGAGVVIEGIEGAGEALFAIETGADFLQGHYFGAARPGIHDHQVTQGLLAELVRLRGAPVALAASAPPAPAYRPGAVARLLQGARALPSAFGGFEHIGASEIAGD